MTKYVVSNDEAEHKIRNLARFRNSTGSWSGVPGPVTGSLGHLPRLYRAAVRDAVYAVFSYDTPIGWVTEEDGELVHTVPDIGYSPTTSQHQYGTAHAWGIDFRPSRNRPTVTIPATDEQYGRSRRLRRGGVDGGADETWTDGVDAYRSGPAGGARL